MVYPDTRCWDIHPDGIDPDNYMTKHGILPRAIDAMIAKLTGTENGDNESDPEDWDEVDLDGDGELSLYEIHEGYKYLCKKYIPVPDE